MERRPSGEIVVMKREEETIRQINGEGESTFTRVYNYGGADYTVDSSGTVFGVDLASQGVYQQREGEERTVLLAGQPGTTYADLQVDERRGRVVCLRQVPSEEAKDDSNDAEEKHEIVSFPSESSKEEEEESVRVLVTGSDFYAQPRVSPCGRFLSYLTWNHPNMPWDGTQLKVQPLDSEGRPAGKALLVAGGEDESITQQAWVPAAEGTSQVDGPTLLFNSDRSNWWSLYSATLELSEEEKEEVPVSSDHWQHLVLSIREDLVCELESVEFGVPLWRQDMCVFDFVDSQTLACLGTKDGLWSLYLVDIPSGQASPLGSCDSFLSSSLILLTMPPHRNTIQLLLPFDCLFVHVDLRHRWIPFLADASGLLPPSRPSLLPDRQGVGAGRRHRIVHVNP